MGPDVVTASLEEVLASMEKFSGGLSWAEASPRIVPLFQRVRPYPVGTPEAVQALVPPGIAVGFGIDTGPAFINVTAGLLEDWSVGLGDLTATGLANLHSLAARVNRRAILHQHVGELPVEALQTGFHIGSTLVLAPSELVRLFGAEPRTFIAPMRDLLLGLPADVDDELCGWLFDEFASQDPNCLAPRRFAFDGQSISVLPLESAPPFASPMADLGVHA